MILLAIEVTLDNGLLLLEDELYTKNIQKLMLVIEHFKLLCISSVV